MREVAFFSDALTAHPITGCTRYARGLLQALRESHPEFELIPLASRVKMPSCHFQSLQQQLGVARIPGRHQLSSMMWRTCGWPRVERYVPKASMVHCAELNYRVPTRLPFIVTIHDIGALTHPHYFRGHHPHLVRKALLHAADRAAAILCVSHHTADAVKEYLSDDLDGRLAVIPNGVSDEISEPVDSDSLQKSSDLLKGNRPFFLCEGSTNPRKNLLRAIKAFEAAAAAIPHQLIIAGRLGWDYAELLELVSSSAFRNRIHLLGAVDERERCGLYQRADAFLYPSLFEGFGLPILEAMANGCPVITSEESSMPEVSGDAALLVDPMDVAAIAGAIEKLANDSTLREVFATRGRERASHFRWQHTADAVAKIYEHVATYRCGVPVQPDTHEFAWEQAERVHAQ